MAERFPAGPGLAPGGDPAKVPVFLLMVSGQIESAEVSAHLCYDDCMQHTWCLHTEDNTDEKKGAQNFGLEGYSGIAFKR